MAVAGAAPDESARPPEWSALRRTAVRRPRGADSGHRAQVHGVNLELPARRAAAQDFDLGGGVHYSGSYPMVFQHSGARPRAERSRVRAKEPPRQPREPRAGSGSRHARQEGSPHPVWLCRQDGLWWATHRTAAARRTLAGPARPRSAPPPRRPHGMREISVRAIPIDMIHR